MASGRYDISAEQGVTFKLHLRYSDSNSENIDLDNYVGRMQVRRSPQDSDMLLFVTTGGTGDVPAGGGVTGGGSTGEFSSGAGVTGSGGITLNASSTGGVGHTGGILIGVDASSMSNVPSGNHFYDLELVTGDTVVRVMEGRFSVDREITR